VSDPIAWGVFVMLGAMGLAWNIRECAAFLREATELAHALTPIVRAWLDAREKKRIGYER